VYALRKWVAIAIFDTTPKCLRGSWLKKYYQFVSRTIACLGLRPHPQYIESIDEVSDVVTGLEATAQARPIRVTCTDGALVLSDIHRVPRTIRGFDNALARVGEAYRLEDMSLVPGGLIIDVGANVGEFSWLFARSGWRVISFEPDPLTFALLMLNWQRAALPNWSIEPVAASNRSGTLDFFVSPASADGSLIRPNNYISVTQVAGRRLDDFLEGVTDPISLLKMDAEGAEPEVLEGLGSRLEDVLAVTIDVGPERLGQPTTSAVAELLQDYGFRVSLPPHKRRMVLTAINPKMLE
jgi:FkbM family methyltransferase